MSSQYTWAVTFVLLAITLVLAGLGYDNTARLTGFMTAGACAVSATIAVYYMIFPKP